MTETTQDFGPVDFLGDLGLGEVPEKMDKGRYPAVLIHGGAGVNTDKETQQPYRYLSFKWMVDDPGSPFNKEMVDSDFLRLDRQDGEAASNKFKRAVRDRLVAIKADYAGKSGKALTEEILSKKGAPVWIEVYYNKGDYLTVGSVTYRDTSITGQVSAGSNPVSVEEVVTAGTTTPDY